VPIDSYGCTAPQPCNLLPGSPAAFDKANPTCEPDGHVRAVLAENARHSTSAGSVAQGRRRLSRPPVTQGSEGPR